MHLARWSLFAGLAAAYCIPSARGVLDTLVRRNNEAVVPFVQPYGIDLRILPLGDSITYGYNSGDGNGYRAHLYDNLTAAGNRVDLIGTQHSGIMQDNDHEGHNGAFINEISNYSTPDLPYRPNVILLFAGTNDLRRGDPFAAPQRVANLIDKLTDACPDAVVLVGTLFNDRNATIEGYVTAFNNALYQTVDQRVAKGKKVFVTPLNETLTVDQLPDNLHPGPDGYALMANTWNYAIGQVYGKGWITYPVPVQISRATVRSMKTR